MSKHCRRHMLVLDRLSCRHQCCHRGLVIAIASLDRVDFLEIYHVTCQVPGIRRNSWLNLSQIFYHLNSTFSSFRLCRFRQLYREERSSQSSDDVLNVNLSSTDEEQPFARRRISKVVVAHNENLETFYDFQECFASPVKGGASFDDVFFDNDSFWSGSITWY